MAARRALRAQQRTRNTLCSSAGCAQDVVAVKAAVTEAAMWWRRGRRSSVARAAEKAVVMAVEARAAVTMGEAPGVGCSGGDGAGGGPVTETQGD